MYSMDSAVRTNKGNIRENNEDNFHIHDTYAEIEEADAGCAYRKSSSDDYQIYAVCDGMGGGDYGEAAAYAVVSNLNRLQSLMKARGKAPPSERIKSFLGEMSATCRETADEIDPGGIGGGCALCMVCISKKHIYIANAGDSRIYLWQNKKITQLTYDHTYAQLLYSNGEISKESVADHPQNNVLVQYMGMPEDYRFDPYVSEPFKIRKGDMFILCSDGLTDMVGDEAIAEKLSLPGDPADICKSLVCEALANGGSDNVTVMVVKCVHC